MPRPRPPHLHRETTRHGKTVWYVRVGHGPRIRINQVYGSSEFEESYKAAMAGEQIPVHGKPGAGTLKWLVERYRETSAWTDLSLATRRQREAILRQILDTAGKEPLGRITRKAVTAGRDRRRETPFQARHYLDTLRGLFAWAVEAELVGHDPTAGIRAPKTPASDGFPAWAAADIAAFEARWPIGTRERVAFDLLRFTGLRRGDAVKLGRPHVRDGVIRFRTEKTGEPITVAVQPELAATLEVGPVGDLTYIAGADARPMTKESFGNFFRDACRAAGVVKSAHGLRKWFATQLAERGATVSELQAACGWTSGRMAMHYTRSADRSRLGLTGSQKLGKNTG